MRILLVNKYFWKKGGSESVFFSEKELLESAGHSVIPFSMQGDLNEKSQYSKYFVDEVDYSKAGLKNRFLAASKIIYSFDAKNKMKTLLADHSLDVAHFHIFQHQISPSVFGPLKGRGIPTILTLHDLKPICPNYKMYVNGRICEDCKNHRYFNCLVNRCTKGSVVGSLVNTIEMYFHHLMGYYKGVDRFVAVSEFYKNKMIEFGFDSEKISYLPNYVDANKYDPNVDEKGYVLYFGRLSEEKGVTVLLDAAKRIPKIPFVLVGTGPLEESLRSRAQEEYLDNVSFKGFKTGKELNRLITEANCIVVPSEWYENCPMAVLEAFAAGKSVIGSQIGGIPELIEQGEDGFTFKPGDAQELSEKIEWIWKDRNQAKEMGMEGRKKVEKHFSAESHYEGLISIYKSTLGN